MAGHFSGKETSETPLHSVRRGVFRNTENDVYLCDFSEIGTFPQPISGRHEADKWQVVELTWQSSTSPLLDFASVGGPRQATPATLASSRAPVATILSCGASRFRAPLLAAARGPRHGVVRGPGWKPGASSYTRKRVSPSLSTAWCAHSGAARWPHHPNAPRSNRCAFGKELHACVGEAGTR